MKYFLYILRCADGTYYVGSTNDIKKRLREHNFEKRGARYTRGRRPVSLMYSEQYFSRTEVLKREWMVKQMSRRKKELLWSGDV